MKSKQTIDLLIKQTNNVIQDIIEKLKGGSIVDKINAKYLIRLNHN